MVMRYRAWFLVASLGVPIVKKTKKHPQQLQPHQQMGRRVENGVERRQDAGHGYINKLEGHQLETTTGVKLEVVKEYKFLGVIIDNGLRFTANVNKVVAKCTRRNGILKCLAGKEWGAEPGNTESTVRSVREKCDGVREP